MACGRRARPANSRKPPSPTILSHPLSVSRSRVSLAWQCCLVAFDRCEMTHYTGRRGAGTAHSAPALGGRAHLAGSHRAKGTRRCGRGSCCGWQRACRADPPARQRCRRSHHFVTCRATQSRCPYTTPSLRGTGPARLSGCATARPQSCSGTRRCSQRLVIYMFSTHTW